MTVDPKIKAEEIMSSFKIILMSEDTECGNEILCTSIGYTKLHPMFLSYWNKVEEYIKIA